MDELGICPGNPWQDVEPPKTDKIEVKVIDDDTLTHFLGWLDERFAGWELPRLFLETKAVTGCRLMDLCGAGVVAAPRRAAALPGRPDEGAEGPGVPLPADLYAALDAIKGETYLWESTRPG